MLINDKYFPKTMSQGQFESGLFTKLPRIVIVCDISPSSFKLKRGMLFLTFILTSRQLVL